MIRSKSSMRQGPKSRKAPKSKKQQPVETKTPEQIARQKEIQRKRAESRAHKHATEMGRDRRHRLCYALEEAEGAPGKLLKGIMWPWLCSHQPANFDKKFAEALAKASLDEGTFTPGLTAALAAYRELLADATTTHTLSEESTNSPLESPADLAELDGTHFEAPRLPSVPPAQPPASIAASLPPSTQLVDEPESVEEEHEGIQDEPMSKPIPSACPVNPDPANHIELDPADLIALDPANFKMPCLASVRPPTPPACIALPMSLSTKQQRYILDNLEKMPQQQLRGICSLEFKSQAGTLASFLVSAILILP
jgi:hypothetical protein